ncbi:Zinc finger transcription factor ace1 [Ophiocordyceps sinensis CO18]|uniref:Zinc finger transcription factor ace1 n=1 Tax=Ophiocordyceps sinensis (strain Co18 / CGMCC 3.14243) TaxID=911162 RepID=T5AN97_OPHSC|nr:Zinc finger transcription factor ace1 [Ophiocordyceps sinensis CO18]
MRVEDAPRLLARGTLLRRQMSDGALAGTVVGVVVGFGLLALCLYPVIIHQIRRRRRPKTPHPDIENGAAAYPGGPEAGDPRRLSSSDSFKRERELSRGAVPAAPRNKEWGLPSHNHQAVAHAADHDSPWQMSSMGADAITSDGSRAASHSLTSEYGVHSSPSPLPFYAGEYMPVSEVRDHDPGVLRGTSADYYSPSIPSEAFGMVTTLADAPVSLSASRKSSFKHNVRHMFRRTSGLNRTTDSCASLPAPHGASALRRIATDQDLAESPTAVSPTIIVPVTSAASPPPQLPHSESSFNTSPSPPSYPAPGTVNPMDIMPASTESELWHRTEHELLTSSHGRPAAVSHFPEHQCSNARDNNTDSAPSTALETPSTVVPPRTAPAAKSPTPMEIPERMVEVHAMDHDASIADTLSQHPISPLPLPHTSGHQRHLSDQSIPLQGPGSTDLSSHNNRHQRYLSDQSIPLQGPGSTDPSSHNNRHQRYLSDQSIPLQGPGSTDLSSHNTPSTQLDSPTPESLTSSDFRHSVSPQSVVASVKTGVFRCDEPGCNQAFDQPHKLKHHQRYHSKDHKCPYDNCGKGFGTKTHLQRHINDRHEKKKKFHCSVQGCDYSRIGGKGFPRKDNWKRHMTKIHNMDQAQLPEPVEADQEMSGV